MTRIARLLGLIILMGVCGVVTVRAQEGTDRPVLDFDGNKVFTKLELLDVANTCLDRYVDAAHLYQTA